MSTGRVSESIAEALRAEELDPLSPIISTDVAEMFYWAGQYDRAIAQGRKTLELHPHYPLAHGLLGWAYVHNGQFREALSEFRKAEAVTDDPGNRVGLGYVAALTNNRVNAEQTLEELKVLSNTQYVSPHHIAVLHAALGERDPAFEWLEKAYEGRVVQLNWLKMDPRFRNLHADPRFRNLLRRLSLES
jgi:tetratricopeptide (TPR) repeat protein